MQAVLLFTFITLYTSLIFHKELIGTSATWTETKGKVLWTRRLIWCPAWSSWDSPPSNPSCVSGSEVFRQRASALLAMSTTAALLSWEESLISNSANSNNMSSPIVFSTRVQSAQCWNLYLTLKFICYVAPCIGWITISLTWSLFGSCCQHIPEELMIRMFCGIFC